MIETVRDLVEAFAAGRGPPAAHPDRQDGPGRPRPRPEGDRHGLRRPGLRRGHRPAVPDPGARPRGRRWRTTCTSSASSSLAAGHLTLVPELKAELTQARPRRHHDRRRRRDPAAGLRGALRGGCQAIFPPGTVISQAAISLLECAQPAPRLHQRGGLGGVIRCS